MEQKKTMGRRSFLRILGAGVGASALGVPRIGRTQKNEFLVGSILPMTGGDPEPGFHVFNGRTLAIEKINAEGGIKSMGGAKIKFINTDHQGKPEVALAEAERLVRQGVKIITGPFMGGIGLVLGQFCEKNKVLFVLTNCVGYELTQQGFKYITRHHFNNKINLQDLFAYLDDVEKIKKQTIKTVGLLYENSIWGNTAAKFSKEESGRRGWNVVADLSYPMGLTDATMLVTKLKAANPDVLMSCSYVADNILTMKTMAEKRYHVKSIISVGSGMMSPSFVAQLGKAAEYWVGSTPKATHPKLPGINLVNEAYLKRFGHPMPDLAVLGYHGVMCLREALEMAGTDDPDKVRQSYARMNVPPGQKGNHNHYPWKFDETGQNPAAHCMVSQIIDGKLMTVWPFDYAEKDFVYPIPNWDKRL
jgi:branched-chain amino acid transport system substrate-binding protein